VKLKTAISLQRFDLHQIWRVDAYWPSESNWQLKFRTSTKSKTADAGILKKWKNDYIGNCFIVGTKFGTMTRIGSPNREGS